MNKTDNKAKNGKVKHTVYLDMKNHRDIILGVEKMRDTRVISYYIAQALREKLLRDNFIPSQEKAR